MASIESIRQLTIQARTQGFAEAQRKIESTSGSIGTMAGAMDRLERSFDPLYRAHDQLSRISRTLSLAVASGTTTQQRANQIWELATQKILKYSEALDRAARMQRQWAALSEQGKGQLAAISADNHVRDASRRMGSLSYAQGTIASDAEREAATRALDKEYDATQRLKQEIARLQGLRDRGAISEALYGRAVQDATAAYEKRIATLRGVAAAERAAAGAGWRGLGAGTYANVQASHRMGSLSYSNGSFMNDVQQRALAAELDPLTAAQQRRDELIAKANAALKSGALTEEQHARSLAQTTAMYIAQERAIQTFIRNTEAAGQGARLTAFDLQNLGYQANDVFSSLASGISPMQTLAQQGPQIYQILAGSQGGLTGGLQAVRDAALSMVRGIGLVGGAIGGLTATALTGLIAWRSYASTQREVQQALVGLGRGAGTSVDQINRIASASAEAGGVSVREARSMAATFASTGRIGASMYADLISRTRDYAATTGQELPDAAKELAQAFADPSRGVQILDERLGGLNDRTAQTIRNLQEQGDRLGAQRALFEALNRNVARSSELMSGWGHMMETLGNRVSTLWDRIGQAIDRVVTGGTLEEQIATLERQLQQVANQRGRPFGLSPSDADARERALRGDLARLRAEQAQRQEQSGRVQVARNNREIMDLVRQLDPAQGQLQTLSNQAEKLRKAIADPIRFGLDGAQLAQVSAQFERLQNLTRSMREDMERFGSLDISASVRAAQNANANVGLDPVSRAITERNQGLQEELRKRGLDQLPTRDEVNRQFTARAANDNLDARDLATLQRERDTRLNLIAQREGLIEAARADTDRIRKEAEEAAKRTVVSQDFIAAMVNAESRGDRFAKNPRSTATGLGQFIEETWERLFRKAFPDRAANMSRDEILGRRTDREDSITLIRVLAEENRRALEKANLPTTNRNQYVAWFAGADRATRLLNADPNEAASAYFSQKAINANPGIIAGRTVGQFLDWADRVINRNTQGNVATRRQADILGAQVRTTDETTYEAARREKAQELLNEAVEKGTRLGLEYQNAQKLINDGLGKVSEGARGEAQALLESADAWAKRNAQVQNSALMREVRFETEQLGRTDSEQRIASRLRGTGLGMDSPEAEGMRMVDTLKEAKDIAKDAFSGLASDLRRGVSAAEALKNVFDRIIDKLMNKGIDALISGLFDGIGGGSSGSSGSGGFGTMIAAASKIFSGGFADGGYTGAGGRFEPAGIVHRGEYVFDAATTSRIGVSALDTLRANLRGYAAGGYVAPAGAAVSAAMQQAANANAAQQGPVFNATINTQSTGDPEADQRNADANAKAMRAEYERMWMAMAQREMRPGGTLHAAGARRAS
ncbi:phage tail length tape measure family protein [Methylobacterium nodulans]|uniref:Bacteriophage tail tape measure N-terminal domain-containing protein n=1 Tax=Methylobacterium nodulans (strain LMG 21967 / CNCM I-2342 / ORS 2060) TaxID=460265 RepID=B8IIM5_METNO|nr:phage tail length tape measure family protein [Methylobacterium nodulans]ACL59902.1 hypothetical protein Mnod_5056 [Methylobacterium nodulans ORS 2060]